MLSFEVDNELWPNPGSIFSSDIEIDRGKITLEEPWNQFEPLVLYFRDAVEVTTGSKEQTDIGGLWLSVSFHISLQRE